jgi:hypothetical protein
MKCLYFYILKEGRIMKKQIMLSLGITLLCGGSLFGMDDKKTEAGSTTSQEEYVLYGGGCISLKLYNMIKRGEICVGGNLFNLFYPDGTPFYPESKDINNNKFGKWYRGSIDNIRPDIGICETKIVEAQDIAKKGDFKAAIKRFKSAIDFLNDHVFNFKTDRYYKFVVNKVYNDSFLRVAVLKLIKLEEEYQNTKTIKNDKQRFYILNKIASKKTVVGNQELVKKLQTQKKTIISKMMGGLNDSELQKQGKELSRVQLKLEVLLKKEETEGEEEDE